MSLTTERFNIETRLAVGWAGLVYRATERQTGFPVALKLLIDEEEITHPLDAPALLRDAQRLRMLSGKHVAQLLDVINDEDGVVLVYQLCDGISGATLPAERRVTTDESIDIAAQLMTALECVERTKHPHGDLKPSNVVIAKSDDQRPFVLLLDWGLSAYRREPTEDSLLFLAPERLAGGPPSLRADFFAAGAVLYYLLVGTSLVAGKDRATLMTAWKIAKPAEALKAARPELPPKFVQWIAGLMELRPEKRPSTVAEAKHALAAFHPAPPPATPRHLIPRPLMMKPQGTAAPKPSAPPVHVVAAPIAQVAIASEPPAPTESVPLETEAAQEVQEAQEPVSEPVIDEVVESSIQQPSTTGAKAGVPLPRDMEPVRRQAVPEPYVEPVLEPAGVPVKSPSSSRWQTVFIALFSFILGGSLVGGVWFVKSRKSAPIAATIEKAMPAILPKIPPKVPAAVPATAPAKVRGKQAAAKRLANVPPPAPAPVAATLAVAAQPAKPAAWGGHDIGSPELKGHAVQDPKTTAWTISAAGVDIGDNSDQFHFVSAGIGSHQVITALVQSVKKTSEFAKAGVMFRVDSEEDAPFVALVVTPTRGLRFLWRSAKREACVYQDIPDVVAPVWLKLQRKENGFTASFSKDGKNWTPAGTRTVPLAPLTDAGYCVTSCNGGELTTAVIVPGG